MASKTVDKMDTNEKINASVVKGLIQDEFNTCKKKIQQLTLSKKASGGRQNSASTKTSGNKKGNKNSLKKKNPQGNKNQKGN